MDINIAFYRLANQIRWKHFRESNPQPSDFLTYPQTRHMYRPESKDELESKLQRIHHKLKATLKTLQPQQKWSNISHTDKETIKGLREKSYECLPSDKGTEFCVIQQDTYAQVALDHLSDLNTYQKKPRMSAKTVENKVNSTWKNIYLQNKFPLLSEEVFSPQTPTCPGSTISSRPTKPARILKYDPSYPSSMDQPNASHGCSPTPSNRC